MVGCFLGGVYQFIFFKLTKQTCVLDGNMQQYVYRQEPVKKCQRRARVTIRYPAFVPRVVIRRRFQRAVRMPTVIRTVRIHPHPSGNVVTKVLLAAAFTSVGSDTTLLGFFKYPTSTLKGFSGCRWHSPMTAAAVPAAPHQGFLSLAGVLRKEIQMTTYWRGLPKVVHSTLSVPNQSKPDGYDYYAFSYSK